MKILIIGASGFVGGHLTAHLARRGHQVEAWSRHPGPELPGVTWRALDLLTDPLPAPSGPAWEAVFHLAAHTRPSLAWTRHLVLENVDLTARVLEHLLSHAPGCRTILASSAHVYSHADTPHRESDPLAPSSPYGLSKQLCEDWALSTKARLDVQIVRAFNQVGPGMPPGLLLPDLLDLLAHGGPSLAMKGRNDLKDFLDIRDAVEAYEALLTLPAPSGSIWNLCSGIPVSVSDLIRTVLDLRGEMRQVTFASDEVQRMLGDSSRLQEASGWRPRRSLREALAHAMGDLHA